MEAASLAAVVDGALVGPMGWLMAVCGQTGHWMKRQKGDP